MSSTPLSDALKDSYAIQAIDWYPLCQELERENAALKQRIIDDNKAYGCEIKDPSGTIWDHAQKLQKENAALREDKGRLDWLEQTLLSLQLLMTPQMDGTCFVGSLRNIGAGGPAYIRIRGATIRAAIDAARKEAQP